MDLRQLQSFLAAARLLHFTQAAEELRIAQPALSQQIRQLEDELGVRLFERTSRRVRLTDAGDALRKHAERILNNVDQARADMAEFAGLLRGRVVIGTLQMLAEGLLPPLLKLFRERYPGIEVKLVEDRTEQLIGMVTTGLIDLAFVHSGRLDNGPSIPTLPLAEVVVVPLATEDLMLAVSPDHQLAGREQIAVAELHDQPLIMYQPGAMMRALIAMACRQQGFAPRIAFEVTVTTTALTLVAAGLGVAVTPRSALGMINQPVWGAKLVDPELSRTVLLVHHRTRELSHAAAAFTALVSASESIANKRV